MLGERKRFAKGENPQGMQSAHLDPSLLLSIQNYNVFHLKQDMLIKEEESFIVDKFQRPELPPHLNSTLCQGTLLT